MWEPRNHPWHCHYSKGLFPIAPRNTGHRTQPDTQG